MPDDLYELTVTLHGRPLSRVLLGARPHGLRIGQEGVELPDVGTVEIDGTVVTLRRIDAQTGNPTGARYQVGELVGRGGMGMVYSAWEPTIGRTVAMKTMLGVGTPDASARFMREAQVTGRLEHPSIIPVHEIGTDPLGRPFYTMKFVRGVTLRQALADRAANRPEALERYSLPKLLTALQKVCDAIALAHSRGVIHRDLKPDNIMLGDFGEVFVLDWGLAREMGGHAAGEDESVPDTTMASPGSIERTEAGSVKGTPAYMAPEQARGEIDSLDERTDIYALGALLYHILALHPPVSGTDSHVVLRRVAEGRLDPLPANGMPPSLAAVVGKAMSRDPADRYASVRALQDDIAAYQNGFATRAEAAGLFRQLRLLLLRHRAASVGFAAALVAGLLFGGRALAEGRRAEHALAELRARVPGMLRLAVAEAAAGRFQAAADRVDEALTIDPGSREGHWRRACALIALERFGEARGALAASGGDYVKLDSDLRGLAKAQAAGLELPAEQLRRVAAFLKQHDAAAEAKGLARRIRPDTQAALAEARAAITQAGGRADAVRITSAGTLFLDYGLSGLSSLDALRGLPLDHVRGVQAGLASLEPLRGMRLTQLAVGGNEALSDLSPLEGLPLTTLRCGETAVRDLRPLRGMPLRTLELSATQVCDLSPLVESKLVRLEISGSPVADLSPLSRLPLEDLRANGCPVEDLRALKGLPLRVLWLRGCQARDYRPLSDLPLESLDLSGSTVSDLTFLQDLPIRELNLRDCAGVRDLAPLIRVGTLDRLGFNGPPELLAPLRRHPKLAVFIGADGEPDQPVAEVWRTLDTPPPR